MKEKICLFAGTTEGRQLAEALHRFYDLTVCVATPYGETLLDGIGEITVHAGRMDAAEMERFFSENGFVRVIDATHPYAVTVTENIRAACEKTGLFLLRVLRETGGAHDAVCVPSIPAARDYLLHTQGNILLTTGAKELSDYAGLDMTRVWARVLPLSSSLDACAQAGILSSHIIAMQGPFSMELNLTLLKQIGAKWMVTKVSGRSGGFAEKLDAARAADVTPILIGQPPQTEGVSLKEALSLLLPVARRAAVIGIGPGNGSLLTPEAQACLKSCDAVLGAQSVLDAVTGPQSPLGAVLSQKPRYAEFLPERVRDVLKQDAIRSAAIVMRGDVGFYSGAKQLGDALEGWDVTLLPGIASPVYFAAKLGISWDDAALISLHGRNGNLIRAVDTNRKVFALTGGENTAETICRKLCAYGFGRLSVTMGERLSYPDERILRSTAAALAASDPASPFDPLSVLLIENPGALCRVRHGICDDEFFRGRVPMTKAEVRSVALSKLALCADSVVYDIGAGTGSVSVECALAAGEGKVFSIEKEEEARALIQKNRIKFHTDNLCIVPGTAPEALETLPGPTHAFIGGSDGRLSDILTALLTKNPNVRIVISAVTLETQAEAATCAKTLGFSHTETVSIHIARSRELGRFHLMAAQNPVVLFVMQGGNACIGC